MFFRIFVYCGLFYGFFQVVFGLLRGLSLSVAIFVGVVAGLLFGLVMAGIGTAMHRWGMKRRGFDPDDPDFSVDARVSLALPISPDEALGRCRAALEADRHYAKVRTDPAEWTVQARGRMSWSSNGEKIECRVYSGDSGSHVEIRSRPLLRTTIMDFGTNRENVERIRAYLTEYAPAPMPAANPPPEADARFPLHEPAETGLRI